MVLLCLLVSCANKSGLEQDKYHMADKDFSISLYMTGGKNDFLTLQYEVRRIARKVCVIKIKVLQDIMAQG